MMSEGVVHHFRKGIHHGLRGCRPSWQGGPVSESQSGSVHHCREGMATGPYCRGSSHPVDQETEKGFGIRDRLYTLASSNLLLPTPKGPRAS